MKPSQVARRRSSHVMLFGEPKTGKSTLVAELLMKGYNLTWVSMDNGHEVLWKLPLSMAQMDEQLNLIIVPDTKEVPVAIRTVLKIVSGAETTICDRHGQVECSTCKRNAEATWSKVHTNAFGPKDILVLDHMQQVASSAMNYIMQKDKKDEEDKPEWDHYYRQGALMDKILTNIQQATYNIICITHVSETELEDGSKKLVPLIGTTNFSRNAGKYFDHIVYSQVKNRDHKFGSSTKYEMRAVTGSRSDIAIENEKVPSLVKFFDGSLPEPVEQGVSAARKVLTTSEKVTSQPTPPPSNDTNGAVEKTVVKEESAPEQRSPPTPPSVDRTALLAQLRSKK